MKELEIFKKKILSLAIEGKLVSKDPKDEPVTILLDKIRQEKEKLIKEKKIKKDSYTGRIYNEDDKYYEKLGNKITDITEEIPFEIPESWQWVRLGNVCNLVDGLKCNNRELPYLEVKYLRNQSTAIIKTSGKYIKKGEVAILVDGENSGEIFIMKEDGYLGSTMKILLVNKECYLEYILTFIRVNKNLLKNNKTGSAIPHLNKELFRNLYFPLPPLEEQKRIVKKIEELMDNIKLIKNETSKLKLLKNGFYNKILSLAIEGKLVSQDSKDEPVTILLDKIIQEKEKLIKEKKIKKDSYTGRIYKEDDKYYEKLGNKITDITEEIPFEIPESWQWVRLGNVCNLVDGLKCNNRELPYLEVKYLRNQSTAIIKTSGKYIKKGEVAILVDGENSGEIFIMKEDGYLGSTMKILLVNKECYLEYILTFIRVNKNLLKNNKTGSAIPHLNKELFRNLYLPLPPLEEQKRIVKKIEELMELCDKL